MIGQLRGKLIEQNSDHVLLDVAGVGYEVHVSLQTLSELDSMKSTADKDLRLFIYTHVREDALQLFGFLHRAEKELFLSLLKVNGIGTKSALTILSGAPVNRIIAMIDQGDAKALSALPKVGKKTAEQMILTLKGKLVLTETQDSPQNQAHREISSALLNLGFKASQIDGFIEKLPADIDFELGVREGLRVLGSGL
jgi:Holliday junction DNA helicase RuvA